MNEKKFLKFTNNKMIVITIFLGAALIGFTTGNVVAQEVKLGSNGGTPLVSFQDANMTGMYELRLNDGTGEFQIFDMTNNRTSLIVGSDGFVGVGSAASTVAPFTIGCSTGACNIQTRGLDGIAANTVKSVGGDGDAKFRLWDAVTSEGAIKFDIKTQDDGTICMGQAGKACMLIFDVKGPNPGQVRQTDGTCIANCS